MEPPPGGMASPTTSLRYLQAVTKKMRTPQKPSLANWHTSCLLPTAKLAQEIISIDMRTGVISLLYKDKGRRDDIDNYRPITVLTTLYKILSRAMALRLGEVIHHIVDNSQAAFQKQKCASDVARLVQDCGATTCRA